jgi:flagellar motility protein MotE (MotC chaperone)
MSSRTLPRSLRVTSAAIVLAVATLAVVTSIAIGTVTALLVGAVIALLSCFGIITLMSEEIRDLRRRWAHDRVVDARKAADRQSEILRAEESFRQAVSQRLRANQAEIEQLREDLIAGNAQIDVLEERLATEQELTALFGLRPEIDPEIVSPSVHVDAEVIEHLRSA